MSDSGLNFFSSDIAFFRLIMVVISHQLAKSALLPVEPFRGLGFCSAKAKITARIVFT